MRDDYQRLLDIRDASRRKGAGKAILVSLIFLFRFSLRV